MGKSSKDKRDAYYRLAKEQGWRARSAFKLIQLDEHFDLFRGVRRVVDLCAAPGSWSQVLSRVLIRGEKFGRRAWEEKHAALARSLRAAGAEGAVGEGEGNERVAPTDTIEDQGAAPADKIENQEAAPTDSIDEQKGPPTDTIEDPTEKLAESAETGEKPEMLTGKHTAPQSHDEPVRIVAVDLQPMSPLDGITTLVGDITHPSTIPRILHALDPETYDAETATGSSSPVDLVVSDGAPDVTGLHDLDIYVQAQLLFSALNLAIRVLRPGGTFVAKIFRAKDVDLIYAQLRCFFAHVHCAKPRSSRASSLEAFVVCRGFELPRGYSLEDATAKPLGQGADLDALLREKHEGAGAAAAATKGPFVNGQRRIVRADGTSELEFEDEAAEANRWIAPFVACGDLSAFDSDATYRLAEDHVSLDPVQPPTAPPYKSALEVRRRLGGFYGKTGRKKGN